MLKRGVGFTRQKRKNVQKKGGQPGVERGEEEKKKKQGEVEKKLKRGMKKRRNRRGGELFGVTGGHGKESINNVRKWHHGPTKKG